MNKLLWKSFLALTLITCIAATAAAETRYEVVDLGTLRGDDQSIPWGINAHGAVVGSSTGPNGQRAFVYLDSAGMFALPSASPREFSVARDINDSGQIVGQSGFRATLWDLRDHIGIDPGTITLAGLEINSEALAINNKGEIVGWFGGSELLSGRHAFVYHSETGMIDIMPRTTSGIAHDINDAGEVVGTVGGRAFIWHGGAFRGLDMLPGYVVSSAFGINALSEVVGNQTDKGMMSQHLFRYHPSLGVEDLGGHGNENVLRRINVQGQSVGQGRLANGKLQALLHTDAGGLQGLNDLITEPREWFVENATDINDKGVIVASAWNNETNSRRAVKLLPVEQGPCTDKCARSNRIEMRAVHNREKSHVEAVVVVQDEHGTPIPGVDVEVKWSLPDKSTFIQASKTASNGAATFRAGVLYGEYVLKVQTLVKQGFEFDSVNSQAMVGRVTL